MHIGLCIAPIKGIDFMLQTEICHHHPRKLSIEICMVLKVLQILQTYRSNFMAKVFKFNLDHAHFLLLKKTTQSTRDVTHISEYFTPNRDYYRGGSRAVYNLTEQIRQMKNKLYGSILYCFIFSGIETDHLPNLCNSIDDHHFLFSFYNIRDVKQKNG